MSTAAHFRPLFITRMANTAPGVMVVAGGFGLLVAGEVLLPLGGSLLIAGGLWLAVRGYRSGVVINQGVVTVRGYVRDISIPRSAVEELTDWPSIVWTRSGETVSTRLWFWVDAGGAFRSIEDHRENELRRLRRALSAEQTLSRREGLRQNERRAGKRVPDQSRVKGPEIPRGLRGWRCP
jgi:hypothetical protein